MSAAAVDDEEEELVSGELRTVAYGLEDEKVREYDEEDGDSVDPFEPARRDVVRPEATPLPLAPAAL